MTNNDTQHGLFNKSTSILTQQIPVYTGGVAKDISASAPSNPTLGDWWYNTTNNHLSRYNGSEWKQCLGGNHRILQTFSTADEAKNWFFTDSALAVFDECCTQLQWSLQGDNKQLKFTMAFGIKDGQPWSLQYDARMSALIAANNWSKIDHTTQHVDSHLF